MDYFDKDQIHNCLISIPELADNFYLRERITDILKDLLHELELDSKERHKEELDDISCTISDVCASLAIIQEVDDVDDSIADLESLQWEIKEAMKI